MNTSSNNSDLYSAEATKTALACAIPAFSGVFAGFSHILSQHLSVINLSVAQAIKKMEAGASSSESRELFQAGELACAEASDYLKSIAKSAALLGSNATKPFVDLYKITESCLHLLKGWAALQGVDIELSKGSSTDKLRTGVNVGELQVLLLTLISGAIEVSQESKKEGLSPSVKITILESPSGPQLSFELQDVSQKALNTCTCMAIAELISRIMSIDVTPQAGGLLLSFPSYT